MDFQDLKPMVPEKHQVSVYRKKGGMPHSQSESNITFRSGVTGGDSAQYNHTFLASDDSHLRFSEESTKASSSPSRGRSLLRTPSPTKQLENIDEDQLPDVPPSHLKRSRSPMKQLFGERGWLGKSMSMKELPSEEYRKTGLKNWRGKIKERVDLLVSNRSAWTNHEVNAGQAENISRAIPPAIPFNDSPPKPTSKSPSRSRFSVSLSPPIQAKFYSEVELMICATANQYLDVQQREGRMTIESLAKVQEIWISKNRPQVIEFMFDQATQRDLVLYNLKSFRFYGPHAENIMAMNSMMQSWKALAKEMSVRTFCTPDSVIRKQMHDCYRILEMLGAPLVTFLAFQEIQVKTLNIMKNEQQKRDEDGSIKFGVEKRWDPISKANYVDSRNLDNPFT